MIRRIALGALAALVAIAVFWFAPEYAKAQVKGAGILGGAFNLVASAGFLYLLLYALYRILAGFLALAGFFLDNAFEWNIAWSPTTFSVVTDGWTMMRDLANGLFILIVLWIAITIIFDLENLGGKKLLIRVIVVALLINFSLTMVSTVFAFGNALARPFYNAMRDEKGRGVAGRIIQNSFIHQVAGGIAEKGDLQAFEDALKKQQEQTQQGQLQPLGPSSSKFASIWKTLGAPQDAQAGFIIPLIVWAGIPAAIALSEYIFGAVTGGAEVAFHGMISLAIADVLYLLVMLAMLTAAILLMLRLAAMMFLSILAPVAFIGLLIPRYGEQIWTRWIGYLFNWAFLAPVFYFLLYISLLFLQQMSGALSLEVLNINFSGNLLKMVNLVLFLVFLWTAVIVSKRMGGAIADTALAFGKRAAGFGLGVVTGGAARLALPAAGRFATTANKFINRIPLLRTTLGRGVPAYGLRRVAATARQQVIERQQRFDGMTSKEIQQGIASGAFRSSVDVAAASLVLQKRKDLAPLTGVQGYGDTQQRRAADTIKELGLDFNAFLRANPTIAQAKDFNPGDIRTEIEQGRAANEQEAAWRLAWKNVRAHDLESMDLGIFSDKGIIERRPDGTEIMKGDRMKEMFLEFARGEHFTRLGRINTSVASDIQEYLENTARGQELWSAFDDKKKEYFTSNAARELAWRRPTYAQGSGTMAGGGGTTPTGGGSSPVIEPRPVQNSRVNRDYTMQLEARGGMPANHTWRIDPRTPLPPDLRLNEQTGMISGRPTAVGPYAFYAQLLDPSGSPVATRLFTIDVER